MSKPKKIGLFWYVKFFSIFPEMSKFFRVKENTIYASLYRNTGYPTGRTEKILQYIRQNYNFNENLAYTLYTEQEFMELLLKK